MWSLTRDCRPFCHSSAVATVRGWRSWREGGSWAEDTLVGWAGLLGSEKNFVLLNSESEVRVHLPWGMRC